MTLTYEIAGWEPPHRLVLRAETRWIRSVDDVRIEPTERGSAVSYDAQLSMKSVLGIFDPLLGRVVLRRERAQFPCAALADCGERAADAVATRCI